MGRKKGVQKPQAEIPKIKHVQDEDMTLKLKEILRVLLCKDLTIEAEPVPWVHKFGTKTLKDEIAEFEEFPYYLYKAVWDDDFEAIQWGEHEGGETILINYKLLGSYLTSIYRPDEYENDYYVSHKISSENGEEPNNRLHYNLVKVFGFTEIDRENFAAAAQEGIHPDTNPHFWQKLDEICHNWKIDWESFNDLPWIEYHHSDFFKLDTLIRTDSPIDSQILPKRKNSKFFKLCQTLKTKYRVRKQQSESGSRMVPIENDPRDDNRVVDRYYLPAEPENEEYDDDYEKQFQDFPYASSEFSNIDRESLSRAREDAASELSYETAFDIGV